VEDELVARAQDGDEAAFQSLVEHYAGAVWKLARVLLPSRAQAEDASQEAWLDVWLNLPRFKRGRPFRPWLLVVVANRCRKALRGQGIPMLSLDGDAAEFVANIPGDIDVADQTLRNEVDADLSAAIATLPAEQQRVLELRFFADLDLAEIALVTETPIGTVKSRLHRALHTLRSRTRGTPISSLEGGHE
jgi:RNA polymerase sigma factor (sigma-70 family)